MKKILMTLIMAIVAISAFAQTWQGHINYTISASGNGQGAQMMNGSTINLSVKDSMSRTDVNLSMMETSTIMNTNAKKGTMLMDMMGNKYAIALSPDDIKQQLQQASDNYDVKYDDSTKLVAGHLCKKAIVTIKKDKKQYIVWYAPDIKIPMYNKYMYSKIDGLPLEYEIEQNNDNIKFTCTLIDTKPVDSSIFIIPDGYTAMSMDQFKQAMGGH